MNIRAAVLAIPVVATLAAASAGAATVTLTPLGLARPVQVAALGSTCAAPYTPAQATLPDAEYPYVAKKQRVEGIAVIGISLSPAGRINRAWSVRSTGNTLLDRAALDAVQGGAYVAERSQCSSVGGDYQVEVGFALDK